MVVRGGQISMGEPRLFQLGAVVHLRAVIGGQRHFLAVNLQCTFVLRDRIVIRLEVCACGVGDRVDLRAIGHRRYATRRRGVRDFACHKAVTADRHCRLRQRCAVIRLLAAFACQRHLALRHFQRAIGRRVVVVRIRRLHLVVHSAIVLDVRHRTGPCIATVRAVLQRCALCHARCCAAIVRLSIVLLAVVICGHRHRRCGHR